MATFNQPLKQLLTINGIVKKISYVCSVIKNEYQSFKTFINSSFYEISTGTAKSNKRIFYFIMEPKLTLTHIEIREICTISIEVKSYFKETYPEVFKFYCDFCKKDTPCSGENWGIECEHEIKFKV